MNQNLLQQIQRFNPLAIDQQVSHNALLQGQADQVAMNNRLAQLAWQDDQAQRQALRDSNGNYDAYQSNVAAAGLPKAFADVAKSNRELQKTQAEIGFKNAEAGNQDALKGLHTSQTKVADYELQAKQFKQHGEQAKGLTSRDDAVNWMVQAYNSPDIGPIMKLGGRTLIDYLKNIPATDAEIPQWGLNQGTSAEKIAEHLSQQKIAQGHDATSAANNAATNATHIKTTAMNNATTRRGQDLVDARTRESTSAAMSKPFEVTGSDGAPVLVQQDKQGNIRPVEGYAPKTAPDKPLTESQARALAYSSRMQSANDTLDSLKASGTTTSIPGSRAPVIGGVINAVSSGNQQKLDQAKRDFINANLRRESGAAISASEFDNAEKQYFPQIGDSEAVIEQKRNNRRIALEGMQEDVPKAKRARVGEIARGNKSSEAPKKTTGGATVSNW